MSHEKYAFLALIGAVATPSESYAQIMIGRAEAIDGDTIRFGDDVFRLYGVDAPEHGQTCRRDGQPWPCGSEAQSVLANHLTAGRLECQPRDIDRYGRTVAVCTVNGQDLARSMAETGYAIALSDFTTDYVAAEDAAKAARVGIWSGSFETPANYRAAHPIAPSQQYRPPARQALPFTPGAGAGSTYFPSCRAAWAAGAAPIRRGQPGYRIELDGDLDGIACEPVRR